MSKRAKILSTVLGVVVLLAAGILGARTLGTAVAQQPTPTPTATPEASTEGRQHQFLARVADILRIPQDKLESAFGQAHQEMRQDAFDKALDKAVEQERITQEQTDAIEKWWAERPEGVDAGRLSPWLRGKLVIEVPERVGPGRLLPRLRGLPRIHSFRGFPGGPLWDRGWQHCPGKASHPWLGVSGIALTPELAEELDLSVDKGVYVQEVVSDSPADNAGLRGASDGSSLLRPGKGGDVISAVDGRPMEGVGDIAGYLDTKEVEDTVELTVVRDGQELTLKATLAEWPEDLLPR